MIRVHPQNAMFDTSVEVVVSNLIPGQKVTIQALVNYLNNNFESRAHYAADKFGNVDCTKDGSVGGFYTGVHPMGLFWSLQPVTKQGRLLPRDVNQPIIYRLQLIDGHVTNNQYTVLSETAAHRHLMHQDVRRTEIEVGRLRGALFMPKNLSGPVPGIIDLFGSAGGLVQHRSALLASHGFAAFSLAYFAYKNLPAGIDTPIELDYFAEATDWLCKQPNVVNDRIGIIGVSLGADIAVLAGSYIPKGGLVVPDFLPAHIAPAVTPPRQITQDMTPETPQSAKLPAAVWQNFQDGQDRTNVDSPQLKEFSSVPPELKVEKPVAVRGSTSTDSGPPEVPQKSPSLQRAVNRNERLAPADTHTTVAKLPLSPSAPKGPPPKPPPRPNQRAHTRSASLDLTNNKTNRPVPKPAVPTSPPPMPPSGNFELREAQTQTEDRLMVEDKTDVGVDRKRLSTTKLMDFEGVEELSIESKKSIDEIPSDWKSRCERLKKMNAELEHDRAKLAEKRLQLELQFEQIKTKAKV